MSVQHRLVHHVDSPELLAGHAGVHTGHDSLPEVDMRWRWTLLAAAMSCSCAAATHRELLEEALQHYNVTPAAPSPCAAAATTSLATTGFHGRLQLALAPQCCGPVPQASCTAACSPSAEQGSRLLVLQALPSGLYADPYELASWAQELPAQLQPAAVELFGPVDLESAAPAAQPQLLTVSVPAALGCSGAACSTAAQTLSIPLHARYQQPAWSEQQTGWLAWLGGPVVHIVLPRSRLLAQHLREWEWLCGETAEAQQLVWSVPTGSLQHADFVAWLTMGVTSCGAAVCSWHISKYKLN